VPEGTDEIRKLRGVLKPSDARRHSVEIRRDTDVRFSAFPRDVLHMIYYTLDGRVLWVDEAGVENGHPGSTWGLSE
jgi:hypothetical protein